MGREVVRTSIPSQFTTLSTPVVPPRRGRGPGPFSHFGNQGISLRGHGTDKVCETSETRSGSSQDSPSKTGRPRLGKSRVLQTVVDFEFQDSVPLPTLLEGSPAGEITVPTAEVRSETTHREESRGKEVGTKGERGVRVPRESVHTKYYSVRRRFFIRTQSCGQKSALHPEEDTYILKLGRSERISWILRNGVRSVVERRIIQ